MMNTDKIYAEQLANEYAPKDTSKVLALRKLDARAKLPATVCGYRLYPWYCLFPDLWHRNVPGYGANRQRFPRFFCSGHYCGTVGYGRHGYQLPLIQKNLDKGKTEICL